MMLLTHPFEDGENMELTVETKLWYALRPEEHPIYRRKIQQVMPVKGLWWMDEGQWTRFLWQGHNAQIIKSGQDPDRVLATRSFMAGGWCYIRETGPDQIDLEGMSKVTGWDKVKKKSVGSRYEWLTVSCTRAEYKTLDKYLGSIQDGCKHEEQYHDYFAE